MSESPPLRIVRVFAASPGRTESERGILPAIIAEINEREGPAEGYCIDLLLWEEDCYADIGDDAQDVINRQIGEYDVFLGFMSTRFGSPTTRSDSGTEEEFNRALAKHIRDPGSIKIQFYFANPAVRLSTIDGYQLLQVQRFRERLLQLGLLCGGYEEIEGAGGFRELVRRHLPRAIRDLLQRTRQDAQTLQRSEARSSSTVVAIRDWIGTSQVAYPQAASFREIAVETFGVTPWSLEGVFQSPSPYFRFGFKLLLPGAQALGETTVKAKGDSVVLHIGANPEQGALLFAAYRNTYRLFPDRRSIDYTDRRPIAIRLAVDENAVCRLFLEEGLLFEQQVSLAIVRRVLLVAWGDEHDYEVSFRQMRLTVSR